MEKKIEANARSSQFRVPLEIPGINQEGQASAGLHSLNISFFISYPELCRSRRFGAHLTVEASAKHEL